MRAFRIYGANDGRYEESPDPVIGPDEALVRVRAVAACGTDLEIYQGTAFYYTSGIAHYPIVPGHEWSGEVVAVGENVRSVKPGDRVVGECILGCGHCEFCRQGWSNQCPSRREAGVLDLDGGFSELMAYPANWLHRFSRLGFEEAALVEPTAVSLYAVRLAETTPADYVAVLGAGPIGLQAAQAARAYGARRVVVIGGRESRRKLALELGADATIDPRAQDLVAETLRLTDGRRFDVVVEASGNPAVLKDLMRITRPRGRVVLVGVFNGKPGALDLDSVVVNNVTIKGSLGSPNVWPETIDLIEGGRIRTAPLITERRPLAEAPAVFAMMAERRPGLVKAVLLP